MCKATVLYKLSNVMSTYMFFPQLKIYLESLSRFNYLKTCVFFCFFFTFCCLKRIRYSFQFWYQVRCPLTPKVSDSTEDFPRCLWRSITCGSYASTFYLLVSWIVCVVSSGVTRRGGVRPHLATLFRGVAPNRKKIQR